LRAEVGAGKWRILADFTGKMADFFLVFESGGIPILWRKMKEF